MFPRWKFDGETMERPWKFDGDSMERPWKFDGETTVGHPAYRPPKRPPFRHMFDTFFSFSSEAQKRLPKSFLGGPRRSLAEILGLRGLHFEVHFGVIVRHANNTKTKLRLQREPCSAHLGRSKIKPRIRSDIKSLRR